MNIVLLKEKIGEYFNLERALDLVRNDEDIKNELNAVFEGKSEITHKTFNNLTDDENIRSLLSVYITENGITLLEDTKTKEDIPSYSYSSDSIQTYYNEIAQFRVFSPIEEKLVFTRVKYATNAKWQKKYKDIAIQHNLRYAFKMARANIGYSSTAHDFQDLINEANIGLMRAVEDFDVDLGFKFSTYATWWIRQAISRSVADKSTTIRVPVHMHESISKYKKAKNKLSAVHGREMTREEMAEILDVPIETVDEWEKLLVQPVSIHTPIGEEEDSQLGDFIPDESVSVEEETLINIEGEYVREELLTILNERQQRVLRKRFGIAPYTYRYTLDEVANQENPPVTRERIRQIEHKALRKLRDHLIHEKRMASLNLKPGYTRKRY